MQSGDLYLVDIFQTTCSHFIFNAKRLTKMLSMTNFRVSTFLFLFSKSLKDLNVNRVSINKHPSRTQDWRKNIISSKLREPNEYKIISSPNAGVPNNNTYACHISSVLVIRSLPKFMYLAILRWRVKNDVCLTHILTL